MSPTHPPAKNRPRVPAPWLLPLPLLLLPLSACTLPTFKGPQIQEAIPGFLRVPDAGQSYKMFPGREVVHHDAWVNASWGDVSTIHINGHPGPVMRADVQNALEAALEAMADSVTFSGLQQFVIDGRTGWGWAEQLYTPSRGLIWIGFRVAVPYDTVTYTVELWSGDPALKRNPDTLVAIASTFGVGTVTWNVPLIVGIAAAALVLIGFLRKRSRERADRLRSITFVKVPKPEEGEKSGEKPGEKGSGPAGGPLGGPA